jgi:hypothetical protein
MQNKNAPRKYAPLNLTEVLAYQGERKSVIWGPITTKSITLLYGPTGIGKSYWTTALLYHIASKERFCWSWPEGQWRSLLLDGEMDIEDHSNRLRVIRPPNMMGVQSDSISVICREQFGTGLVPNISAPINWPMYLELFAPFQIIVIDNLNTTSYPMNDRDSEIQQFQRTLNLLLKLRDSGKAIIMVHHTNKAGEQMGSILKEQIASNVIELRRPAEKSDNLKFEVVFKKHRHVAKKDAKNFTCEAIPHEDGMTWLVSDPDEGREDRLVEMLEAKVPMKEIQIKLGLDAAEVYLAKKRLSSKEKHSEHEYW